MYGTFTLRLATRDLPSDTFNTELSSRLFFSILFSTLFVLQRNQMKVFASITHAEMPARAVIDRMSKEEAGEWIHGKWAAWVAHGKGAKLDGRKATH